MENKINVAFITDNKYAILTGTAIQSLFENRNKNIKYEIIVICNDVTTKNIECFKKMSCNNFKIKIIALSDKNYKNLSKEYLHVTTTALLKFNLPEILNDYDKVLYVDGDVLFQDDLTDLYFEDISEVYAGVCVDYGAYYFPSNFRRRLKIKNKKYFNTGMMLLNLEKFKRDNIYEKLIDYRKNGINYYMDQDTFNVVLGQNVKYLNSNYNFLITTWRDYKEKKFLRYLKIEKQKEMLDYLKNAKIVHFCSQDKPSKYEDVPYSNAWYDIYKKSPFFDESYKRKFLFEENPRHIYFTNKKLKYVEKEKLSSLK